MTYNTFHILYSNIFKGKLHESPMHYLAVLHFINIITAAVLAQEFIANSLSTTFKAQKKLMVRGKMG